MGGGTLSNGPGTANIDIFGNDFNVSSGTLTNGGTFSLPSGSIFSISSGGTFINNSTLNVNENASLNVDGDLKNKSSSSVNIYGTTYTYSYLENGDAGNAGTININYPGALHLLGGIVKNANAGSAINVNAGGALKNYHGTVDISSGTLTVTAGASFNNVRGNNPGSFTIFAGGVFDEDGVINLVDNLEIDYTWTITNKSIINANGKNINFGTYGEIFISGSDASLSIQDAIVENISGNKIRCSDDTTTLSVDNVTWIQDANYSFTKGTLSVNGLWTIQGRNTSFIYSSNEESTIQKDAELIFDRNVTFSYNSATATNLAMIDDTSILHLNGATLQGVEDLRLTKGIIAFDESSTFSIESGKTIYFGNNSTLENITLEFGKNSQLTIAGDGTLTNQNV
jgi:hypothetical protein